MASKQAHFADAVAGLITSASLGITKTVTRAWWQSLSLDTLTGAVVAVSPESYEKQIVSRSGFQTTFSIASTLMVKSSSDSNATLDTYAEAMEKIADTLIGASVGTTYKGRILSVDVMPFDETLFNDVRVFTGQVTAKITEGL